MLMDTGKRDSPKWGRGAPTEAALVHVWQLCHSLEQDRGKAVVSLLSHFEPMVRFLANVKSKKLSANIEVDDLQQEARIAVVDFFEHKLKIPEKCTPQFLYRNICGYLQRRVRGAMDDYLRRIGAQEGYDRDLGWLHHGFASVDEIALANQCDEAGRLEARNQLAEIDGVLSRMNEGLVYVFTEGLQGESSRDIALGLAQMRGDASPVTQSRIMQLMREAQMTVLRRLGRLPPEISASKTARASLPTLRGRRLKPYPPRKKVNCAVKPNVG